MSRLVAAAVAGVIVALAGCRDSRQPLGPDPANIDTDGSGRHPPGFGPIVLITSPADHAVFRVGAIIPFEGRAFDLDEGDLSDRLRWTLGDSLIGRGRRFWTILPPGTHVVVASAADSAGAVGSDSVTVTVGADSLNTPPRIVVLIFGGPPFVAGREIVFNGTAWDREDGDL